MSKISYEQYYIEDSAKQSNCVVRSFCKLYNQSYEDVYSELCDIAKELGGRLINDSLVFEEYMKRRNTNPVYFDYGVQIKDLELDDGDYIIFCYDKKDFYHMVPIINNTLYDRTDESLELYPIKVYQKEKGV